MDLQTDFVTTDGGLWGAGGGDGVLKTESSRRYTHPLKRKDCPRPPTRTTTRSLTGTSWWSHTEWRRRYWGQVTSSPRTSKTFTFSLQILHSLGRPNAFFTFVVKGTWPGSQRLQWGRYDFGVEVRSYGVCLSYSSILNSTPYLTGHHSWRHPWISRLFLRTVNKTFRRKISGS